MIRHQIRPSFIRRAIPVRHPLQLKIQRMSPSRSLLVLALIHTLTSALHAQVSIGADDPNIQYVGRFDMTNPAAPGFDWSLCTIRAKFQGTSCSVKLDGPGKYFDVFIDGAETSPIISTSGGLQTFVVASGLSDNVHSISICRRAEATAGKNIFRGFVLDGGKTLVAPGPGPTRKIEFIGDSFTCGYGVETTFGEPFTNATENARLTYAGRMASHYNADCMITARSGHGMVRNYNNPTQTSLDPMPFYYPRTCGSVASNDYAFTWQPDVVVVVLGINDFSTTPYPSEEQYVGGYSSFITTLRGHYPNAHILCTYWSGMNAIASNYIAAAVSASGDGKVHFANVPFDIDFPDDYGADYHPNVTGQTKIADAFIPVFDSIMGATWGGHTTPIPELPAMKARYAFEGNSLDTSGSGNNGTTSALSYVSGKVGAQAAQFNGTSSHVSIPRSVTDDLSVAMWVKTTDTAGAANAQWWSGKGLVDGEVGGGGADWGTAIVNGKFALGVGSTGGDTTIASSVNISDGAWHHVAATRNNTTGAMAVYVDGVLRGSGTGPTGSRTFPAGLRIGSLQTGNNFLNGTLDDVRLYDRVLTAAEVSELTGPLPATPAGLLAAADGNEISLSWNPAAGASRYIVKRSTSSGGPYATIATNLAGTTYTDTELNLETTYYYVVSASNMVGESAVSSETSATTLTARQSWRMTHFGTIENTGDAADSADPDGDGWTNEQEFVSGTGPNDRGSLLRIDQMQASGNDMLVSFPSVLGRTYRVERSDTLLDGSWTSVQDDIPGTDGTVQIADPGAIATIKRFYRIIVW